jgi:hypothetical protein
MEPKSTKARMARPRPGAAQPAAPLPLDPQAIASRAYALYEARGRTPGNEREDWLLAERQLLEEREAAARTVAPSPRPRRERARPAEV